MKTEKLVWKVWLRDHYTTNKLDFHIAHNLEELRHIIEWEKEDFPVVEPYFLCEENNYSLFSGVKK